MSLNLSVPDRTAELKPKIVVFGVGGAGGNAVNNMIRSNLEGVECVVANTDAQALTQSLAERRLQLGRNITQGLGAGSRPDIGRAAAEEGIDEILEELQGVHMAFIAAGMGGGTGTGASPVIARAARDQGILTVGVVTKPFHFEGPHRMQLAEDGLDELQHVVDTMIVIPNQNLFLVATEKTTFADAFKMADHVLYSGVRGVTDLMVMPGLINLDFADIRTVMSEMGKAMMGAGEAHGEERARAAAEQAIANPLLDDVSMKGARGVLINITGGLDMTLYEVDESVNRIRDEVDPNANLIFGSTFDESLEGQIRVSVFATGIDAEAFASKAKAQKNSIRLVAEDGTLAGTPADPEAAGVAVAVANEETLAPVQPEFQPEAAAEAVALGEAGAQDAPIAAQPEFAPAAAEAGIDFQEAAVQETVVQEPVAATAPDMQQAVDPSPELIGTDSDADFEEIRDALQELAGKPIPYEEPADQAAMASQRDAGVRLQSEIPAERPAARQVAGEPHFGAPQQKEDAAQTVARFPNVDAGDRIPESNNEDLLEIPAFLRRQAN